MYMDVYRNEISNHVKVIKLRVYQVLTGLCALELFVDCFSSAPFMRRVREVF